VLRKMRRSVYFHIDEVARDAVVAANLRRVLAPFGVRLVYGNRANSEVIRYFKTLPAFDLCIFPSMDLFRVSCPQPDRISIPVILLPAETVGGTSRNLDRVAAKYFGSYPGDCVDWLEKITAFCLWGPSHYRVFETMRPHLVDKCHVVGHPRFDYRCQRPASLAVPSEKIRIGIISRFPGLNPFDGRGTIQIIFDGRRIRGDEPIYRLSPDRDIEDRIYVESIDLRTLFQIVDRLDRTRHEVILRAHPREDRTVWERLIARNKLPIKIAPWDQPFMHWVKSVDYVLGPVSTSFFDSIVGGKVPVCTIDLAPHRQSHILAGGDDENRILNYVLRPKSVDEVIDLVSSKPPGELPELSGGVLHILHEETNYPDCFNSLDRLARVCLDVLDSARSVRTTSSARLRHELFAAGHAIATRIWHLGNPEQSSSFVLNRRRKQWIDALAWEGSAPIGNIRS